MIKIPTGILVFFVLWFSLYVMSVMMLDSTFVHISVQHQDYSVRSTNTTTNSTTRKKLPLFQPSHSQRFPKYGSIEFSNKCNWTHPPRTLPNRECAFLVRPSPTEWEGISKWTSEIVVGYLFARQSACALHIDYGPSVQLSKVLQPVFELHKDGQLHNWTVPANFQCNWNESCFSLKHLVRIPQHTSSSMLLRTNLNLTPVPYYRQAMNTYRADYIYSKWFEQLEKVIPGFQLELGVPCSFGELFHLAPTASQFETKLFVELLPTLQDKDALVMAVYIRTTVTEKVGKEALIRAAEHGGYNQEANNTINCALSLEKRYLQQFSKMDVDFSKVVWLVMSDFQQLKKSIQDKYNGQDANENLSADTQKWPGRIIPRKVVITESRGMHTRTQRNPDTAIFAEGLIDWWLMGEADLIITDRAYSFGTSSGFRTATNVYDVQKCKEPLKLVHKERPPRIK